MITRMPCAVGMISYRSPPARAPGVAERYRAAMLIPLICGSGASSAGLGGLRLLAAGPGPGHRVDDRRISAGSRTSAGNAGYVFRRAGAARGEVPFHRGTLPGGPVPRRLVSQRS